MKKARHSQKKTLEMILALNKEMPMQLDKSVTPSQPSNLKELEKIADKLDRLVNDNGSDELKAPRASNKEL